MNKIFVFIVLLTANRVLAQDAAALRLEKMKSVYFLAGNWKGEGWMLMEDGRKHPFNQTEKVTSQLDGGVLIVEGKGKDPASGRLIHDALALLTYDVGRKQYRWTAMTAVGYTTDIVPEIKDGTFIWTLDNARTGKIRYSIKLDKGDWFETGEVSTDGGQSWKQNFEMRLKKVQSL